MRFQTGEAHQEIGLVRVDIFVGDGFVRSEIFRVQVAEFLIAMILDGLVVPLSAAAGIGTNDDGGARVGQACIDRDDGGIVFADIDDRYVPDGTDEGVLHAGSREDVRVESAAKPVHPKRSFQKTHHDSPFGIGPAFFQDIMIRNPGILQ